MFIWLTLLACRETKSEGWDFKGKIDASGLDHCVLDSGSVPNGSTADFDEGLQALEGPVIIGNIVGGLDFSDVVVAEGDLVSLDGRACPTDPFHLAELTVTLTKAVDWTFHASGVAVGDADGELSYVWSGVAAEFAPVAPPAFDGGPLLWAVEIDGSGDGTLGWWEGSLVTGQVTHVETVESIRLQ